ncbi:MAG: hypothetical protein J6Y97_07040 [Prevotella sp.]|nr:hypothetical protein [Prevotella sp.]
MNKIYHFIAGVVMAGLTLTACSPDEFEGADPNGLPTMDGIDFTMNVDQEVNQVTFQFPETKGVYPIWIINGATYSTLSNVGWSNTEAGTYPVELKLGNRNGISQGSIIKHFTFNETKVNYTNLFNRIKDKEWRIDNKEVAHLACGPLGGDGTGWWSAAPDEKKAFGVYDDRITFTPETNKGGTFTYSPGADGMTYVNKGTTHWGSGDEDFDAPTQDQTSGWHFERGKWTDAEGKLIDVDYLVLDANTLFPYISADRQYEEPRFRIETLTASSMVLIYENEADNISWRYIFTSKAEEKGFEGFDPNSDFNMWKTAEYTMFFYYAPGWAQLPDPDFQASGNDYTVTLTQATSDQWQAQMAFKTTNISTSAAHNYDFSCIINSNKDLNGATVKLVMDGDDNVFYFTDRIDLKAGEDYIFWKSDMPGIDMDRVNLFFDFGGCQEGTIINIRNIVLKDHANDDGTILPNDDQGSSVTWVAVDSPDNLGAGFNKVGEMQFWWADAGWSQIGDPQFSFTNGVYTIIANSATSAEWQAQNSIHNVAMNIEPGQLYDVRAKITSSDNLGRYTFKICDENDDDNTLIYNGSLSLEAGDNIVEFVGVKCAKGGEDSGFSTAKLFIDLGGCPAGLEINLSDIIVQKHNENGGGGGGLDWDWKADNNLWKAIYDSKLAPAFWYAPGWVQTDDPDFSQDGDVYTVTLPVATTDQWMAQMHFDTDISAKQGDKYNFYCVLESDNDHPGVTIKLTQNGDDNNFFFAPRVALTANEPYIFKQEGVTLPNADAPQLNLFFDFGGNAAGNTISISKIYLVKAE